MTGMLSKNLFNVNNSSGTFRQPEILKMHKPYTSLKWHLLDKFLDAVHRPRLVTWLQNCLTLQVFAANIWTDYSKGSYPFLWQGPLCTSGETYRPVLRKNVFKCL